MTRLIPLEFGDGFNGRLDRHRCLFKCFIGIFLKTSFMLWLNSLNMDYHSHVSPRINPLHPVVPAERVQVDASVLLDGVAGEPAAEVGGVVPATVVVEPRLGVVVLRREAEGEGVGHGAGLGEGAPEGVGGVGGDDLAGLGDVVGGILTRSRKAAKGGSLCGFVALRDLCPRCARSRSGRSKSGNRIACPRLRKSLCLFAPMLYNGCMMFEGR